MELQTFRQQFGIVPDQDDGTDGQPNGVYNGDETTTTSSFVCDRS